jgi:16S rRNA (guanine527-N7)-methyltransferase
VSRPRTADLVAEYSLGDDVVAALDALVELIATDEHAPTTVRDRARIANDHLADSLAGLRVEAVRAARVVADLGSGAGMPGIPLALALPDAHVALVESNRRKADFLLRALAAAHAPVNAEVVRARAEEWRGGLGACDVITARALGPLPVVLEYAAPLLRLGGTAVVWRGRRDPQAEAEAEAVAELLGLQGQPPMHVVPYRGAEHRNLHLFSKVRETPSDYPRRPGMAVKRPITAGVPSDRERTVGLPSDRARR